MHESTIDRNALEQLRYGIMPWTASVPKGLDPLPYFTGRHIGRPLHGFTLTPGGAWRPAVVSEHFPYHCLHLADDEGYLPALDSDFAANLDILVAEVRRGPENGLQRVKDPYIHRAAAWYRGITAFPHLYPTALQRLYTPIEGSS